MRIEIGKLFQSGAISVQFQCLSKTGTFRKHDCGRTAEPEDRRCEIRRHGYEQLPTTHWHDPGTKSGIAKPAITRTRQQIERKSGPDVHSVWDIGPKKRACWQSFCFCISESHDYETRWPSMGLCSCQKSRQMTGADRQLGNSIIPSLS